MYEKIVTVLTYADTAPETARFNFFFLLVFPFPIENPFTPGLNFLIISVCRGERVLCNNDVMNNSDP